jgi:hypothetical protein
VIQSRKTSGITYTSPGTAVFTSRMRPLLSRNGIAYTCTAVLGLVILSIVFSGSPEGSGALSPWSPTTSKTPVTPTILSSITELHKDDSQGPVLQSDKLDTPGTSMPTTQEQTAQIGGGLPIISTNNNGSVVLLTGAAGLGNFRDVQDFYNKITTNRLEYANSHGTNIVISRLSVGYDFMTVDLASYVITHTTHPVWGKLPAILEAFAKYSNAEWIWWLDNDAIIMTPEIDLHRHLLDPEILQKRLFKDQPILILDETHSPIDSGLLTPVHPSQSQLIIES